MNRADRAVADLPGMLTALRPALHAHAVRARQPDGMALPLGSTPGPRPTGLHLHQATRDGISYVGIELACPWDEARRLGALMHGRRVVDLGEAAVTSARHIAEQDAANSRTGLDEALLGHWDTSPFAYGVMETSEFELRADGTGWSLLAQPAGEYVTRLAWRCPEAGVLELRDENGLLSRHRYVVTTASVTSVGFEEPVEFGHQYAKSG
ncbi:hypothetical protein [Streptomyces sp. NPDC087859]|uniref:hypothetical protein n=1 Tax=Streptomyces sp. NPDC087859 TaxID=3365812 RepID=UPI0037FA700D